MEHQFSLCPDLSFLLSFGGILLAQCDEKKLGKGGDEWGGGGREKHAEPKFAYS